MSKEPFLCVMYSISWDLFVCIACQALQCCLCMAAKGHGCTESFCVSAVLLRNEAREFKLKTVSCTCALGTAWLFRELCTSEKEPAIF